MKEFNLFKAVDYIDDNVNCLINSFFSSQYEQYVTDESLTNLTIKNHSEKSCNFIKSDPVFSKG